MHFVPFARRSAHLLRSLAASAAHLNGLLAQPTIAHAAVGIFAGAFVLHIEALKRLHLDDEAQKELGQQTAGHLGKILAAKQ